MRYFVYLTTLLAAFIATCALAPAFLDTGTSGRAGHRNPVEGSESRLASEPGSFPTGVDAPVIAGENDVNSHHEVWSDSHPRIDLLSLTGGQDLLNQLGIERDFDAWARSRGFRWGFNGSVSPYKSLSVRELSELAASGDKAAELELAKVLMSTDPARALEIVESQALEGNMDAIIHAAALYGGVDNNLAGRSNSDLEPAQLRPLERMRSAGVDPEIESMAWALVFDSYMGYPVQMAAPEGRDAYGAYRKACERAVALRAAIESGAATSGREMPSIEPAPFGIVSLEGNTALLSACGEAGLPQADFSGCQPIEVYLEGEVFEAFVCP